MRVHADRGTCIGAGMCVMAADDVFDQDEDGLVTLLVEEPDDDPRIRQAVTNCPSGALTLEAD